jgi:SAM-dependent methyltransferase
MKSRNIPAAPNFDPIARPYRWMEFLTFGRLLEHCRNHFIPQLAHCRRALVLGDGDGRFLAALLADHPTLHADAVDTSPAMLRLLARRTHAAHPTAAIRLRTHQTSALTFIPQQNYDLIVTHFFLDCLTQPEVDTLATRLAPHLTPKALWLVSDFRTPAGPMHWPACALVRALYLGFRLLTGLRTNRLPDHTAALTAAGFSRIAQRQTLAGLLTTELWEYTPTMQLPPQRPKGDPIPDPVPDPEPASPSLPEPDPGVFHHETAPTPEHPGPSCRSRPPGN